MENQETEINLPCESNHCNYEIIYQYPETTPGLFSIINGFTLRSGKIDREMSEIAFLAIPQFILQLKLNSNTRWKREIQEHEYVLVPKPFLISKNEITITVIIDDENDNPPVFVQRSPLLIGYPSKSLIKYVAPEFLTTVKATDKDVGENATIKYTSDSDYFTINSENGDIYPSEDLLDHLPIDFLITAKDQNGAGLPTTLQIKVQPVEAKHLISITIKNGMLDDVKGILELLSDKTKYLIRDMTAIVLPVGTYFYNVDAKHYAEVVVYGFSGDDLLTNDYLLSAILEANEDPNLTAVTWRAKCAGPQSNITFDQEYYLFEIGFSFTGPLPGVITASSIPEQPIEYSLKDVPDLKGKVIIDSKSGVITITNKIRVGTYVLSVNAEGTKTHEVAKTTVTITVPLDGYNNIITKHIDENAEDKIILPCETNDCDYAIISQTPETDNLLFTVDGYTLQYAKIDREMDELFHLPVPQFTLSLKQKPTRMKRDISEREWALIPNPVVVSRHEIIMIVIIDDVNDNHPVFNEKQPLLVGYPSSELLAFIAPPYLATIKATDKDAGVNSSIMYTSNSQYFQIHPRDGVIYPSDDALDHLPSNFTITATDRNGEGLETPFNVQVQPLNDRHLVYLEIQKVLLDEIEGVLKTLSDKTNYEIKHLIANILPIASGKSFVRDLNSGHYTEVVVYGFDSSNLVNNDVLIKAINDANVIPGLTAKKWESCSGNQEPTHSITFDKDYYLYKIDPSFIGLLEKITATCTPAEHITYSLEFKDESLKGKAQINVKTGELKIVDQVGTGNYVLVVKAKVLGTEIEAITPVTIYVDGQVDVLIKHVRENTANQEIILPCSTTTCQYTIISQYPDTNPYLFNVINGNVLVTNSLDREMTEIINQPVPQFSVRLKDSNTQRDKRQADKHDWALLPDTLTHNHNEIIVSIIVDDVNDNPPEFEAGPKLTVGYPSKHLLTYVNPQYLTIVQATDKDDGDNAKIYYSTMNEFYRVHPTSGIIYAAEDLGSLVFTVTATNRDADPTLSSDIEIEVKLLDDDHLVELTIGDVLWEDINSVLEEISKKSNVVVRSLTTSFTVPNTQKEQRSRNGKNASFQATLVVYALDLEGYQPVPKGRLARIFSDSEILDGSTIIPWDPSAQFCNNEEYDDTGYIAATIVLAVILLLALVALIAVVYYYKFYKVKKGSIFKKNILKNHSRLNDESEKSNSSDNIQRRQTGFIFNPPPVEEDEISIVGSDNSTSSGRKFDKLSEPALSDSRPAEALNIERRKSVTFNESVQKVNILVDTEESENDSKAPDFLVYRL